MAKPLIVHDGLHCNGASKTRMSQLSRSDLLRVLCIGLYVLGCVKEAGLVALWPLASPNCTHPHTNIHTQTHT